jgi:hypothetical protein
MILAQMAFALGACGGLARILMPFLVPEHQELGILGNLVPGQHRQTAEPTTYEQVNDRNDHSAMIPAEKSVQVRSGNRAPQGWLG